MSYQNRIVEHVSVRAGDLVPHPLNFRRHPESQRTALVASLEEVGFARSLLGYRLPDGKIQLIDGHLRAELDPDAEVVVELLDVTDEEAHKLLLTLDPLAALAETDAETHAKLQELVATESEVLDELWQASRKGARPAAAKPMPEGDEQFLVVIECDSEKEQVALLRKLQKEGLTCRALIS